MQRACERTCSGNAQVFCPAPAHAHVVAGRAPGVCMIVRRPTRCVLVQEALAAFERLSPGQYATGWVLSCVGRACFEAVDYQQVRQD